MGIKDANGCTATQTVQVTQPTALTINVSHKTLTVQQQTE
jgi:hypothetical protein